MLLSPSVQLPATLCHPVCHSKGHIILHSNSCVVVVVWRLQTKEATRGAYLPEKLGETGANTPLTHKLQHRIRLPHSLEKHLDVNTWDKSTTVFLETQIHSHVDLHHFLNGYTPHSCVITGVLKMHAACNNSKEFLAHLNNTDVYWDPLGPELQKTSIIHDVTSNPTPPVWKTPPLKHASVIHKEKSLSFRHPATTTKGNTNAFLR